MKQTVLLAVWRDALPNWLSQSQVLGVSLADWIGLVALAAVAVVVGIVGQRLLLRAAGLLTRRTGSTWDDRLAELLPGLLGMLIGLLTFGLGAPLLNPGPAAAEGVEVVVRTLLIIALTVLAIRLVNVGAVVLKAYLTRGVTDENHQRSVHTQVAVPRGILRVILIVIGIALVLLQFDVVRSIGISLLASAGVAGLIIGLAAQKAVSNLLAGIQLAVFQPVRIGDAVVVEGEWGWVEEIGLTHVVIKVWDLRRLLVPVSYFLDKPFQNWTRGESDLLGTVFVYADYTIPVDDIRTALAAMLKDTPLWDGRAQGVQVTNLSDEGVELRVLVSASDGSRLWDLRCLVREKLLNWLEAHGRPHLPMARVELVPASQGENASGDKTVSM